LLSTGDTGEGGGAGREVGSAADWAFDQLRGLIVQGDLAPGARITEEALCTRLAVSRTPLRDALRRLEMAGLIVRQRNRSLRVADLSLDEMVRLSMLRDALEGTMARHVARRYAAGEVHLDRLDGLVEEMAAVEPERGLGLLLRLGEQFHRELRAASGDPFGARLLDQVLLSFERYRHLIRRDTARARDLAIEHAAIMAAIRSGDADAAEAAIRRHLCNARAVYARRLAAVPAGGEDAPALPQEGIEKGASWSIS